MPPTQTPQTPPVIDLDLGDLFPTTPAPTIVAPTTPVVENTEAIVASTAPIVSDPIQADVAKTVVADTSFVPTIEDISLHDLTPVAPNISQSPVATTTDTPVSTDTPGEKTFELDIDLSTIQLEDDISLDDLKDTPEELPASSITTIQEPIIQESDATTSIVAETSSSSLQPAIQAPIESPVIETPTAPIASSGLDISALSLEIPSNTSPLIQPVAEMSQPSSISQISPSVPASSTSQQSVSLPTVIASELDHDHPVPGLATTSTDIVSTADTTVIPASAPVGINIDAMLGSLGTTVDQLKPAPITLITQQPLLTKPQPSIAPSTLRMSAVGGSVYRFIFLIFLIGVGLVVYYRVTDPIGFERLMSSVIGSTSSQIVVNPNLMDNTGSNDQPINQPTGDLLPALSDTGTIVSQTGLSLTEANNIESGSISDTGGSLSSVVGTSAVDQLDEILQPEILVSQYTQRINTLIDTLKSAMIQARSQKNKDIAKRILSTQQELQVIQQSLTSTDFDAKETEKKLTAIDETVRNITDELNTVVTESSHTGSTLHTGDSTL